MSDAITSNRFSDASFSSKTPKASDLARLRRLLRSMSPSVAPQYQAQVDASDIIQQTMLEACQKFDDYRGKSDAEMIGWLRQMLAHNHLDAVRRMRSQKRDVAKERQAMTGNSVSGRSRVEHAVKQTSPSGRAARSEELERVNEAIGRLPPAQSEAVRLHHLEGKTLAEIATEMSCSRGAVAGLLHRGLQALQREMSEPS